MKSFDIVVDSNCDLPQEYLTKNGIDTLPMQFTLDGQEHNGGSWQDISPSDFYSKLGNGSLAQTSQVNPGTYFELFEKYAKEGKDLVMIILSSGLSGSYASAVSAAKDISEQYPDNNIFPIDSITASMGCGVLTWLAVQKREEGLSAADTAKWLDEKKNSVFSLFTVDDLHFLHRGGRLSKVSAVAGSLLGVKPLLNVSPDGNLKLKDKARGRKAAIETLLAQMKRCVEPGKPINVVGISHGDCLADAQKLGELIKGTYDVGEVIYTAMSPIIGAHTGPGGIALFFEGNITRAEYEAKYYPGK